MLDVFLEAGLQSAEEEAITAQAIPGFDFDIYYVHDFELVSLINGDVSHEAKGGTKPILHTTYIRDGGGDVLNCTAHEVGHQLGLDHSTDQTLSDGKTPSPTYVANSDPTIRLMYLRLQATNPTLLIKPEWDIINKDSEP